MYTYNRQLPHSATMSEQGRWIYITSQRLLYYTTVSLQDIGLQVDSQAFKNESGTLAVTQ
jgi:hypothetical protein